MLGPSGRLFRLFNPSTFLSSNKSSLQLHFFSLSITEKFDYPLHHFPLLLYSTLQHRNKFSTFIKPPKQAGFVLKFHFCVYVPSPLTISCCTDLIFLQRIMNVSLQLRLFPHTPASCKFSQTLLAGSAMSAYISCYCSQKERERQQNTACSNVWHIQVTPTTTLYCYRIPNCSL